MSKETARATSRLLVGFTTHVGWMSPSCALQYDDNESVKTELSGYKTFLGRASLRAAHCLIMSALRSTDGVDHRVGVKRTQVLPVESSCFASEEAIAAAGSVGETAAALQLARTARSPAKVLMVDCRNNDLNRSTARKRAIKHSLAR